MPPKKTYNLKEVKEHHDNINMYNTLCEGESLNRHAMDVVKQTLSAYIMKLNCGDYYGDEERENIIAVINSASKLLLTVKASIKHNANLCKEYKSRIKEYSDKRAKMYNK